MIKNKLFLRWLFLKIDSSSLNHISTSSLKHPANKLQIADELRVRLFRPSVLTVKTS